ncbi:metal ABC transporter substrate-binding protein [Leptolyngbya sp. NIES-2104]|uniref:metal ABC transporter substrate-binding protein n=1 Tax=Leptolyngbya sp. NIES-2104 TaxID=1552121 RepID=UPI0006ECA7C5|nr:metal ABC transporter substrate-binding protein [Leptolyngbya sp. NIES-2104]GAP98416.1 zinc ABC transporter, periplasmic-binding protein ZnuA [Leptolyngbya sp. NIES-2104]
MRRNPNHSPLVRLFAATLFVSGAAFGAFLISCGQSTSPQAQSSPAVSPSPAANTENRLRVVATFLPIYLFTKAVAGDAARVDILIKPGTEVHDYQSTPADVRTLSESNVVVKNGLGMEEFLDNTIKSAQNPKLKIVDASQGIKPVGELSQVVQTGKEHSHDHAEGNPHVWLDPVLAKQQVENIRDGLSAADPDNKAKYEANAAAYLQQLATLNQEFEQRLGKFRDRTFITFHDAFPYLAQRYNLKQVAVVEIPEDQLSPADVKETIDTVKQFQAKALFSEPGVDNKLLDGLSKDLNVKLRPLDSLEAGQTDPQHYFTAMRANLQTLEEAFK